MDKRLDKGGRWYMLHIDEAVDICPEINQCQLQEQFMDLIKYLAFE